jgi:hypothetical protein
MEEGGGKRWGRTKDEQEQEQNHIENKVQAGAEQKTNGENGENGVQT